MRTKVTQSIAFDPEVLEAVKAAAEKEDRSVSWLINNYLAERFLPRASHISTDMDAPPAGKPSARRKRS